jgi:hypothetical protein
METARDLVIIILGVVVIGATIFIAVLWYLLYRNLKSATKSIKIAAAKCEALATFAADEVAKPLVEAAFVVQGIARGMNSIRKIMKGGER